MRVIINTDSDVEMVLTTTKTTISNDKGTHELPDEIAITLSDESSEISTFLTKENAIELAKQILELVQKISEP